MSVKMNKIVSKELLTTLRRQAQLSAADKTEKANLDMQKQIQSQREKNSWLQKKLDDEELINKKLKRREKAFRNIWQKRKQEIKNNLVESKDMFEETVNEGHFLRLKLQLKESIKAELEVSIDDERNKYKQELEIASTAQRDLELVSNSLNDVEKQIAGKNEVNERLEKEIQIQGSRLDQMKR